MINFEEGREGSYYIKKEYQYTGSILETYTGIIELCHEEYWNTFTIDQLECILNKMKELQREKR